MKNITITQIPVPTEILKGDWYGIVYAVDTTSESEEQHDFTVEESIQTIRSDFNKKNHHTVSLRETKKGLVFADKRTQHFCTLVQFRVRDSY